MPVVGLISPERTLKVVVLPAPFTPSNAKHSPFFMPKDTLSMATLTIFLAGKKTFLRSLT